MKLKIFTSFVLTVTFLVSAFSGLAMYLAPKGRIANWIEWSWAGFTKEEWTEIHTVFVTVFLLAAIFHLFWFNWKVFWAYLSHKAVRGVRHPGALLGSIALGLVLWFGTVYEVPPVYSLVQLSANIDASYENKANEPPVPHAEELTVAEFASEVLKQDVQPVLRRLEDAGYKAESAEEKLVDLAERYGAAPSVVFKILDVAPETGGSKVAEYSGYGQKTVATVCVELEVSITDGSARLQQAGMTDFSLDETLKTVADRYGKKPVILAKIIAGEE